MATCVVIPEQTAKRFAAYGDRAVFIAGYNRRCLVPYGTDVSPSVVPVSRRSPPTAAEILAQR